MSVGVSDHHDSVTTTNTVSRSLMETEGGQPGSGGWRLVQALRDAGGAQRPIASSATRSYPWSKPSALVKSEAVESHAGQWKFWWRTVIGYAAREWQ